MSPLAWLIIFFFVLLFLCVLVYVLVVRAFYWGDKGEPPKPKARDRENPPDHPS
jgi:hypothetical protein